MYTKSKIQLIKESLSKKHDFECGLTELMDKYNITDAIFVIQENINEVKLGYFDTVASYDTLNEAIKNCDSDIIISTRDIHNDWLGKYGKKDSLKIGWEHNYHNNEAFQTKTMPLQMYVVPQSPYNNLPHL